MSNMSYCRHQNTARDLQDVFAQWNDYVDISEFSKEEIRGRKQILEMSVAFYQALVDAEMIDEATLELHEDAIEVFVCD